MCHASGRPAYAMSDMKTGLPRSDSLDQGHGPPVDLPPPGSARDGVLPVVGRATRPLLALVEAFAATSETLLLRGPRGSGKSRLAELCHLRSPRRHGPFQQVDLLSV